jgi:hypothetical protein
MDHTAFRHSIILVFASSLLYAQQPLEPPLRNWAAALYWAPQPGEIEHERAALKEMAALPPAAGIFTPPGPLTFIAITPCRIRSRTLTSPAAGLAT